MSALSGFARIRSRTLVLWAMGVLVPLVIIQIIVEDTRWAGAGEIASDYLLYGVLALWVVWQCARSQVSLRRLIGAWPRDRAAWGLVALAIPLVLLSIGAIWVWYLPLSYVAPGFVGEWLREEGSPIWTAEAPGRSALLVLSTVLVAPAVEEILFRGVLLHRWAHRWGQTRALLATSLAFAVLHADLLGSFVFGVVMALLYVRTRTLLVPIACHALNNAIAVGAEFFPVEESGPYGIAEFRSEWWIGALALALALPLLYASRRRIAPPPGWRLPYAA